MALYAVSDMESLVRSELREPVENKLTSAEILTALNDGYKDVSSRAFCIENEDTATTVLGDRLVSFDGHRVNNVQNIVAEATYLQWIFDSWTESINGLTPTYTYDPSGLMTLVGGEGIFTGSDGVVKSAERDYDVSTVFNFSGNFTITGTFNFSTPTTSLGQYVKFLYMWDYDGSGLIDVSAGLYYGEQKLKIELTDTSGNLICDQYDAQNWQNLPTAGVDHVYVLEVVGRAITLYIDDVLTGTWTAIIDDPFIGTDRFAFAFKQSGGFTASFDNYSVTDGVVASEGAALLRVRPETCGHISIKDNSPQYWFQHGNNIVIEPVPDDAYSLKLFVSDYPSEVLALDADVPDDLPDEFHSCVVDFACYVLSMKLKKWKQASKYYNDYINNLKMRRKEYIQRKAEKKSIHNLPTNVTYSTGTQWAH